MSSGCEHSYNHGFVLSRCSNNPVQKVFGSTPFSPLVYVFFVPESSFLFFEDPVNANRTIIYGGMWELCDPIDDTGEEAIGDI
jgi:hypothetical protein